MRFHSAAMLDRRQRLGRRATAHALVAALIGIASGGCASLPQLSHKAVLTPTEQAGLGAVAVSELLGTAQPTQDQQQIAVTSSVGQRLAAASGRSDVNWDFKVVQHARPIAVALPDGTVLLTDTLLARCRTEAELAAVLAKEMGCMLAGVYPAQVVSPFAGHGYTPLDLGQLTPADQSPAKPEDHQAADSIGLSLLVSAGYDPSAAMTAWLPPSGAAPADNRRGQDYRRRPNAAQEQSFTRSLTQARTVYQSHSAKLGNGNPLAFAAARPVAPTQPQSPAVAASTTASSPMPAPTPLRKAAASAPAPSRPITPLANTAEFSSDGDFLPPTVASDRPGDGRWSAAAEAGDEATDAPRDIQQTSFEQPQGPTLGPALP